MRTHVKARNEGIARERRREKLARAINRDRVNRQDYWRADVLTDALEAGLTLREIAWGFSVANGTIERWLNHHGIDACEFEGSPTTAPATQNP